VLPFINAASSQNLWVFIVNPWLFVCAPFISGVYLFFFKNFYGKVQLDDKPKFISTLTLAKEFKPL